MNKIENAFEIKAIELLKTDQHEAFELIYTSYAETLLHYTYQKVGDKKIAEDIVQNVFIQFWENTKAIRSSIYGYLINSIKFQVFNYYRSCKVKTKYLIHLSVYIEEISQTNPYQQLEAKELFIALEELISKLPNQCRKVFLLSRFENLTNEEIAEQLMISKKTVENYITQALAFIRMKNKRIYYVLTL
ncbi:RNA polymerase sigma-70 factor [Sphingobacterium sp. HJSM2_6]|uniref:RNA polymerase sigma-70 factor n=1 Tax=Sphingobacterium sp. HJSM2_6 TaxID=3366264 RepID=UPI003BC82EAC